MTVEEAIKEIERQKEYADTTLRDSCNKEVETVKFIDGMVEAYRITLGILREEE
jgi:hypothetical protein